MKGFLLVLLAAAPCFSQTTWSGLQFGMTPQQAHLALNDRPSKDRLVPASRVGNTDSPEMFFIDVQGVSVGQHKGDAHLRFDEDQKLAQVSIAFITFDKLERKAACFEGISNEEAATRSNMAVEISEEMIGRFGKPVSETGSFPTSQELAAFYARGTVTGFAKIDAGKRIWRTEGQVIEESLSMPCGSLFLMITYKPQTKEL
jgi:hypothetical protein